MVLDPDRRLLAFAKRLHAIEDFGEMVRATAEEVREAMGYQTAWLAIFDNPRRMVRVLAVEGANEADVWAHAPEFPIDDDPYLQRVLHSAEPQVIRDAQDDPDVNRDIVRKLGNRTIVSVPMRLVDQPFGALGTGSFGDEGVRVPTEAELAHLVGVAGQLVTASARLILARERQEAQRRQNELSRRLAEWQRLESLGQLAGGVAHDFNNLLTIIVATTSMLLIDESSPARRDELRNVMDAAGRAGELTRRLLALGQRQPLSLAPTAINDVIDSVLTMIRRVVPAHIQIDPLLGHQLPRINVDLAQLEQVLVNLCLNARDAMPEGGRLTIESEHVVINGDFVQAHPWAKAGRYVLVTLTDTGTGIDDDVLERIFEPFFTTKPEGRGSGLGLAVCRGIVAQHGGMIHAYSERGVGTTMKVYLPVSERLATTIGTKLAGPVPGGHERILLADDQEHVRRVLQGVLTRAGYEVVTVPDGKAAVDLATNEHFDLVVLDAVMPVMGGRDAFVAIRSTKPRQPVLFTSGYGAEELTARFLEGADAPLLPKPFDPDTLLRAVRTQLDAGS